jgi:hypothetical protein
LYRHVPYHPVPSCTCLENLELPCTILYSLVQIGEILHLLVQSCTKPQISCTFWYCLVLSCTNRVYPVLTYTVLYQTQANKYFTGLNQLVLACTNQGNLVLAGTGTDWCDVPVQTSTVRTNIPVYVQDTGFKFQMGEPQ